MTSKSIQRRWQWRRAHQKAIQIIRNCHAMNVMRMEKGFKSADELTNEVTPAEADTAMEAGQ